MSIILAAIADAHAEVRTMRPRPSARHVNRRTDRTRKVIR